MVARENGTRLSTSSHARVLSALGAALLLGMMGLTDPVAWGHGDEPHPVAPLKINLASPGHWHVTRSKVLNFTVTDATDNRVAGLHPVVTIKTLAGTVDTLQATDNGDGTYSVEYVARDIGSGYAMAYGISCRVEYESVRYFDAWPVEVVRDGNEHILPAIDGTLYAYQVRYGWDPGTIYASDTDMVNLYFEPRRAIQEGNDVNVQQPWRNSFNHLTDLTPTVIIASQDGLISETLTCTYLGLGVYRAQRTFPVAEVGAWREYTATFLFTDPYNGFAIDPAETAYPLVVSAPRQDTTFDPATPESVLLEGMQIFQSACAACHDLPTAEQFQALPTDDALVALVTGMAEGAALSPTDTDKVVRYALALRHGVAVGASAALDFVQSHTLAALAGYACIGLYAPARRRRNAAAGRTDNPRQGDG